MSFSVTPLLGTQLGNIVNTAAEVAAAGGQPPHRIATRVTGADGREYVYARVNTAVSITAGSTTVTINSSGVATSNTGGSYTAPNTAMSAGDFAWFSKAGI